MQRLSGLKPDSSLRDYEKIPLKDDIDTYFEREVKPHAPDGWIDPEKTKVGYEIPFNRHFYVSLPPQAMEVIDAELRQVTDRIQSLLSAQTHEQSSATANPRLMSLL